MDENVSCRTRLEYKNIPDAQFEKAEVYNITPDGNELIGEVTVTDQKIYLELKPCQAVAIKAE